MRKILSILPLLLFSLALGLGHPQTAQSESEYYESGDQGEIYLLTPEELDDLLAPIALYPDPLIAQILPAATFIEQIEEAAEFVRRYGQSSSIDLQPWDVSVKAVAHYPDVLSMMAEKKDWTASLGQAFIDQQQDVMDAIQRLRAEASAKGNLYSTPEQQVIYEEDVVRIVPARPEYVYVPVYDPQVIYVERYNPVYPFITFSTGFTIGAWLNRDCDWRHRRVYYHGWRGDGWVHRARPHIHDRRGVYINRRASVVRLNERVLLHDNRRYRQELRNEAWRRRGLEPPPPRVIVRQRPAAIQQVQPGRIERSRPGRVERPRGIEQQRPSRIERQEPSRDRSGPGRGEQRRPRSELQPTPGAGQQPAEGGQQQPVVDGGGGQRGQQPPALVVQPPAATQRQPGAVVVQPPAGTQRQPGSRGRSEGRTKTGDALHRPEPRRGPGPIVVPATKPAIPPTTRPAIPTATKPAIPPTTKPAIPPTTRPAIPPTTRPAIPPTTRPSIPAAHRPAIPPTMSPAIPTVTRPAIPPTTRPALPPTTRPAIPTTTRPAIPPTTRPAIPPISSPALRPAPAPTVVPAPATGGRIEGPSRPRSGSGSRGERPTAPSRQQMQDR